MAFDKTLNWSFKHSEQGDKLYDVFTAAQIKEKFDSRGVDLKAYVDKFIDYLQSADGLSAIGLATNTLSQQLSDITSGAIQSVAYNNPTGKITFTMKDNSTKVVDISSLRGMTEEEQDAFTDLGDDVSDLQDDVSSLQTSVSTNTTNIESLNSQLAALSLQIDGNKLKLFKGNEVLSTVTLPSSSVIAETYTITNTLSHCSTSNSATSIEEWSSYSATITADSGYDLGSISVTMGETNITSTAVRGSTINIDSVEGNLVITCTATEQPKVTYTITNTLTHVTNSNSATSITENSSYLGTLSANTGYILGTPVITMGGTDITSSAYNSSTNAISISSVTGNIVITCSATVDPATVIVGSINSSNEISLTGLSSGTYTLKYEDSTGTPLTDWENICDMEVE